VNKALLMLALCAATARAQQIQLGSDVLGQQRATASQSHVELLSEAVTIDAGKPQLVEFRFRVQPGFHINSHTPKDELLIPTVLRLDPGPFKVLSQLYPSGVPFKLPAGSTVLDVYQNEFRVTLRGVAQRGQSMLTGSLRYQACDNAACYPPRTLQIQIAVTAK
jgi:hypothetical protein